jgi:hypothetical protein
VRSRAKRGNRSEASRARERAANSAGSKPPDGEIFHLADASPGGSARVSLRLTKTRSPTDRRW